MLWNKNVKYLEEPFESESDGNVNRNLTICDNPILTTLSAV